MMLGELVLVSASKPSDTTGLFVALGPLESTFWNWSYMVTHPPKLTPALTDTGKFENCR